MAIKIFPDGALCGDSEMIVIAKNVHTRAFKRAFLWLMMQKFQKMRWFFRCVPALGPQYAASSPHDSNYLPNHAPETSLDLLTMWSRSRRNEIQNPDKDMLNVKRVTRCSTYAGIFLLLAHEIHERGEKVIWIRVFWLEQIFEDFLDYD